MFTEVESVTPGAFKIRDCRTESNAVTPLAMSAAAGVVPSAPLAKAICDAVAGLRVAPEAEEPASVATRYAD